MNKVKLGEIADYSNTRVDCSFLTIANYVGTDNIKQNRQGKENSEYTPNSGFTTEYRKNDILVANIRPYLKKIWFATNDGGSSADVLTIRIKDKNYLPKFVYYSLFQDVFFDYAMKGSKGSKMPRGDKKQILNFPISDFNLTTQTAIARVLSSLDDKIELNNKINRELENLAKTIYEYWFVQFDFPDANGKPYKSSGGRMLYNEDLKREIPEGWEVRIVGDIINPLESGKRPKGGIDKTLKDGIPSLGAECIDRLGVFNFSSTRYIPYSYKRKITSGVIKNNDILIYKDGAYVGKTTLFRDNFPFSYAVVNEHVFLMRAMKKEMQEYLLLTLMQNYYFNLMQSLGQKAAQPGLNQDDLKGIIIIVPNDCIINKFNCIINTLFEKLFLLANQNQRLSSLRDFLLPLLMNGQVAVGNKKHKDDAD